MTIPRPNFMLIDECPGWCTYDHSNKLDYQPGDHGTTLLRIRNGDDGGHDDEIRLDHCAEHGLEVSVDIGGDQALCTPIEGAPERMIQLARALLTAVYRLDVIEAAEESVAGMPADKVSYSLDFGAELLTLKQAVQVLESADPDASEMPSTTI